MKKKTNNMNKLQISLFSLIILISFNSCEALANIQQSQQSSSTTTTTTTNNDRSKQIVLPSNVDRNKTTAQLPAQSIDYEMLAYGERYRDNIFTDIQVSTEYYAKNVKDFEGNTKNLVVDIISAKNDVEKNRPCIVYIYGGGFSMKIDDGMQEICKSMALKGYVVAAIDYRLGFYNSNLATQCKGDFYEGFLLAELRATQDAIAAVKYLKANASRLGINPDMIIIGGQSAGAITALDVAYYDNNETDAAFINKVGGSLDATTSQANINIKKNVAGVFSLSGAITNPTILNNPNNTPTFLVNGTCDEFIYAESGAAYKCDAKATTNIKYPTMYGPDYIYRTLKSKNNPTFYIEVCQSGHAMNNWGYQNVVDWVTSFTYAVIKNKFKTGNVTVFPDKTTCTLDCK